MAYDKYISDKANSILNENEFDYSSKIKPSTKPCKVIWCNKKVCHGKIGFCAKHFADGLKQQLNGIHN